MKKMIILLVMFLGAGSAAFGQSGAPVKAGQDGLVDLESIHESNGIDGKCRWLAIAEGFA